MKTIGELHTLIENNQIRECLIHLKHIFSFSDAEEFNDAVLLLAREAKYQSDTRKGLLMPAEKSATHAQLLDATISLINMVESSSDNMETFNMVDQALDELVSRRSRRVMKEHEKSALYERLTYLTEKKVTCQILWIDNHPENNEQEVQLLRKIGLQVEVAISSEEAEQVIQSKPVNLILSDRSRGGNSREGLDYQLSLVKRGIHIPVVFYVGHHDKGNGIPPYAFGMTDSPTEILHLAMDVIQRG